MATTHLFVELLVIGFGVMIWILLIIFAGMGVRIDKEILDIQMSAWPLLMVITYVFGILLDRIVYSMFDNRKNKLERSILGDTPGVPVAFKERIVMEASGPLNDMICYNRSRSRICRAWFINFLLIGICFIIWQSRVSQVPTIVTIVVAEALVVLSVISFWVGDQLEGDHYQHIKWSYQYHLEQPKIRENTTTQDPNASHVKNLSGRRRVHKERKMARGTKKRRR